MTHTRLRTTHTLNAEAYVLRHVTITVLAPEGKEPAGTRALSVLGTRLCFFAIIWFLASDPTDTRPACRRVAWIRYMILDFKVL